MLSLGVCVHKGYLAGHGEVRGAGQLQDAAGGLLVAFRFRAVCHVSVPEKPPFYAG